MPFALHAATNSFIAGLDPPYGASGSCVLRSLTKSIPQKTPAPRISPITLCFLASSINPGPKIFSPMFVAFSSIFSVFITSIVATAAAAANGCPIYVSPPGNTCSSNVLEISLLITTPPSGTYPDVTPFAKVIRSGTALVL